MEDYYGNVAHFNALSHSLHNHHVKLPSKERSMKNSIMMIRANHAFKERIQKQAERFNCDMSTYVRMALSKKVEEDEATAVKKGQ